MIGCLQQQYISRARRPTGPLPGLLVTGLLVLLLSGCGSPSPETAVPPTATATSSRAVPSTPTSSADKGPPGDSPTPGASARQPALTATLWPSATAAAMPAPSATQMQATSTPPPPAVRPTRAASPLPSPLPVGTVTVTETTVTIPTYPFAGFLHDVTDPINRWTWPMLDQAAYAASDPRPVTQSYRELVLENEYLRLTVLPDLGGRIYECIFKPTGHDLFYKNPVLKPSPWGPPARDGLVAGWLAAGGLEWELPVDEHGYAWGTPWAFDTPQISDTEAMITVFQQTQGRLQVSIDIVLEAGRASFILRTRLTNPTDAPVDFKYWHNAMLAPGGQNRPSADLQFILPVQQVTVHSTRDPNLPTAGQAMSWPVYGGRDLSRLGNWHQFLGFFARPAAQDDFMGVYDPTADEGLARVFPSDVMPGAKFFGLGWSDPLPAADYTDDQSGYVEMHGGLAPTFDDTARLDAGQSLYWEETWFPVSGLGSFVYANQAGALNMRASAGGVQVDLFPTSALEGSLAISIDGSALATIPLRLSPARPFRQTVPLPAAAPDRGTVAVQLLDVTGGAVLQFEQEMALR